VSGNVINWAVEAISLAPASVVTIGVFDGLHLGHQWLIGKAVERAHLLGVPSACVSFYPDPETVLRGAEPCYLMLPSERAQLMLDMSVDLVVLTGFGARVARMTASEFMQQLCDSLHPREVLVGEDFALGRGREGIPEVLAVLGRRMGYDLRVIPRCRLEGRVVSSTLVRGLIQKGDVATAARFLGRLYAVRGAVLRGHGRGRELGFPTANVAVPAGKQLPADGVYAAVATVAGHRLSAAANIGRNPTFGAAPRALEAHLLDFQGDLYATEVEVGFVARLRAEVHFPSIEALEAQMVEDVAAVRRALGGAKAAETGVPSAQTACLQERYGAF